MLKYFNLLLISVVLCCVLFVGRVYFYQIWPCCVWCVLSCVRPLVDTSLNLQFVKLPVIF
jgi:hypothetical protein